MRTDREQAQRTTARIPRFPSGQDAVKSGALRSRGIRMLGTQRCSAGACVPC